MITMNIFIAIIIITCFPAASAVSTIKVGDQLNLTSQLVSPGRRFTLGFFTIRETGSTYLGIWYTSDSSSTKVWVANRSNPIMSNSSVLMIDPETGNLIIATGGETLVNISDNQSGSKHNLIATLQDIGDFQLKNENDNRLLWKSFDYPANVLLPGMKVGLDVRRRHKWELTSWLSDKIPDLGAFTLGCDWHPSSKLMKLSIRYRGIDYWEYPQENYKWGRAHGYNISYYYNNTELQMYLSYSKFTSGTPMWILTPNGQVLDGETSSQLLGSHDFCYGSYSEDGCLNIATTSAYCRSESHDRFTPLNGEFTGAVLSSDNNSSLSTSDCMKRCWDDCDCLAFNSRDNGVGCDIWTGTKKVKFSVNPKGTSVQKYVLVSPKKEIAKIVIWGPVVSGIFLLLLCLGLLWYLKNRKLQREGEGREKDENRHLLELTDLSDTIRGGRKGSDMEEFSFAEIVTATNDFSDENKLGQGDFGIVYKGRLSDEREVAIKRLSRTSGKGLVEFKNELILVPKLQHKNIVKVLGWCIHGEEHMIITEYMPNKCLDSVLFDETRKALLDWPKRWNIIEGIAQGLLYLHKYSRQQVIHTDLKATNVLLDERMNPKISDFGMARILEKDETEVITKTVDRTIGYMSREYAMYGASSVKSDVFSFGVLILEIVSGRRNTRFSHLDKTINLIEYAWELWQQGDAFPLQDPTLVGSCAQHQLSRIINVALLCVQENAGDRPVMSEVMMLINDAM